jgi:hypothetical protein
VTEQLVSIAKEGNKTATIAGWGKLKETQIPQVVNKECNKIK